MGLFICMLIDTNPNNEGRKNDRHEEVQIVA